MYRTIFEEDFLIIENYFLGNILKLSTEYFS